MADIEKKKRMLIVIKSVVKRQRGSFSLEKLKDKMNSKLKHRNFVNDLENKREIGEFINKMKSEKKLFKYHEEDTKYFYVH